MLGRVTPGLFTVLYLVLYFCGTPICCVTGRTGKDWNPVAAAAAAASRKAGRFQTESRLIFPATLRPFPEICGFVQLFFSVENFQKVPSRNATLLNICGENHHLFPSTGDVTSASTSTSTSTDDWTKCTPTRNMRRVMRASPRRSSR